MNTEIGPYKSGEIPAPIIVTMQDSTGAFIPLSGYTAKWVYRLNAGASVERSAALVTGGSTGAVQYTWVAADFATPGYYEGEMWVGNGNNRFASITYCWTVESPVADSVPNI